jgi:CheY-like chemotaxis protein
MLLQNPRQVLEHGCLGYRFDLTTEEADLVSTSIAGDIHAFSLRVWEWMSRNSHAKGSQPLEAPTPTAQSVEDILATNQVSSDSMSIEEHKEPDRSPFASQSSFLSHSRRVDMGALILVVDDHREMAEGLQFGLEMEGFRVALASDGELAIEFLEREQPDLILADIKMPRMDGYALLHVVKQNTKWRHIPFVFVTAAADWREAVIAKSIGADEYIVKPFELEDLVRVVKRLTKAAQRAEIGLAGEEGEEEKRP